LGVAVIGHEAALVDVRVALEVGIPDVARALERASSEVTAHAVDALANTTNAVVDVRAREPAERQLLVRTCKRGIFLGLPAIIVRVFVAVRAIAEKGAFCFRALGVSVAVVDAQLALGHIHVAVRVGPSLLA